MTHKRSAIAAGAPLTFATAMSYPGLPPKEADVVVIGGGVIGVSAALFLARAGRRVALLEKGRVAAEQSSRNWGWIRQQGRDPDELPIMVEANRLWPELAAQTGADIGLKRCGVTYLAQTQASLERFAGWLPHAKALGLDTRLLTCAETHERFPEAARSYVGALHTASDMHAEPALAVPALAALAAREGVSISENCAARCLDVSAGRVAGVLSETGRITCSEVVVAAGAWSALFLGNAGVSLPQLSVRATVAATTKVPSVHLGAAADGSLAFRRRADGGYTLAPGAFHELFVGPAAFRALPKYLPQMRADLANTRFLPSAPSGYPDGWLTARRWDGDMETPFERMRVLDPVPNRGKVRALREDFATLFPKLPSFAISRAWAGMIDTLPDLVPVIDRIEAVPGLTVATGMSGHGFGIGPGIGRIVARLVAGEPSGHDLTRFRFGRFGDGTEVRLGPAL